MTGPTTAGPVATSPGIQSFTPGGVWASRRKRLAFGAAGVALAVMLIGAIFARGTGSDPAIAQGSAAAGGSPGSSAPSAPLSGSNAAVPGAAPDSSAVLRFEDLPAPSTVAPAAAKRRPSAPAAPAAAPVKKNCSPPYELDATGNKRWKRECL
jgi:hypothetical protein